MNVNVMDKFKEDEFKEHYKQAPSYFETTYGKEVKKLLEQVCGNNELFSHIVYCNDIFKIQPVYTFWMVFRDYLEAIFEKEEKEDNINKYKSKDNLDYAANLKRYKDWRSRSIGAWFGYIFKFILEEGYTNDSATYCPKNRICNKATYFTKPKNENNRYTYWTETIKKSYIQFKSNGK